MVHIYVLLFSCDVTSRQQIVDVVEKAKQQVGVITILVNNAGIMPTHPLLQQTEQEITKTFNINVMAHFWVISQNTNKSTFASSYSSPNNLYCSSFKPCCRT